MGVSEKVIKTEVGDFDWINDIEPVELGLEYLRDNFSNLEMVRSGFHQAYYVDSERKPFIMYYPYEDTGSVWVNSQQIWSTLRKDLGFKYNKSQEIIKRWLEETYKLTGLTPIRWDSTYCKSWKEPIY